MGYGENIFSLFESPQRFDTAPSIGEVGKLQVMQS
jgi:hypothetical protein